MAWYPGAAKMELQPESDRQSAIVPTQFLLHSIAAPWTPGRIYEYWRDSTNLESHWGLGYDGSLAQFIGTETRADANAAANLRPDGTGAVSLESASNLKATDQWTPEQVEQIIRLGVWLHQRHGIPLRICRSWDDPGYGYHRMFPEWNPNGHSCPGDARVKQFHDVVFPGIVARANPTPPAQEDDMPTALNHDGTKKTPLKAGTWTTLDIAGVDLLKGIRAYHATAHLTIEGLPAGRQIIGRFYHLRPDGTRWDGPMVERVATLGVSYPDFSVEGSIKPDEKVRFEVQAEKACTVTASRARGLAWA